MQDSLAFWYDGIKNAALTKPPRVELHFNLWRDLLVHDANFFDVGINFLQMESSGSQNTCLPAPEIAKTVDRFHLFIPGFLERTHCVDLSPILSDERTLKAVFNEVVAITEERDDGLDITIRDNEAVTIHRIADDEIEAHAVNEGTNQVGTIFSFMNSLCQRIAGQSNHYLRIRFTLDTKTRELFYADSRPADWPLLPSFARTELSELRWNERRSFPLALSNRSLEPFAVSAIHYFLVRDAKFELVSAHTNFHKIRRLEDSLWTGYLLGPDHDTVAGRRAQRAIERGIARQMIIYHWRVRATDRPSPIEDFIAFAKFKVPIPNLWIYAIVICCLGAAGNALYAIDSLGIIVARRDLWDPQQSGEPLGILENLTAIGSLVALATLVAYIARPLPALVGWLVDKARHCVRQSLGI